MIALRLLGGTFVEVDGEALTGAVAQRHPLALLALLARAPSSQLSRDKLLGHLWPDRTPRRARHRLRDTVYAVRSALGTEVVLSVGDDLRLNAGQLEIDVLAYEAAVAREDLADAVALYAGPFLDGFYLSRNGSFERWAEAERTELARSYRVALRRLAEAAADTDRPREAVGWWQRLAAEAPYDSEVAVGLMRALAAAGDPAGALRHAETHAARLAEDLEAVPHHRVQALAESLGRASRGGHGHSPAASAPAPGPKQKAGGPELSRSGGRREEETGRFGPRAVSWGRAGLGILSVAVLIGVAATITRSDAPPADPHRLAVFPFSVQGDGAYAYLGQGLIDLLSIKLALADQTQTVDPMAVVSRTSRAGSPYDVGALAHLAHSLGAGTFLHGSIVQSGDEAQIIAHLYSTEDAEPRVVANVSLSKEASLFEVVDRLSRRLLGGWLARDDADYTNLAGLTTTSLPAFKAYLAGERALREGRYRESVERFAEATDLDPDFALAHYRTSVAANWVGLSDLVRSGAVEAWRRREGLPERARRLVEARYGTYISGLEPAESIRLLREIVADYPDDVEARYQLADLRFHNGWLWGLGDAELRADFERLLSYDTEHQGALTHLVRLVARQQDFRAMDTLLPRGPEFVLDGKSRHELVALAAFSRHDRSEQDQVLERLRHLDDESLFPIVAVGVTFSENVNDGARLVELFHEADRSPHARSVGLAWSASLQAARGRLETARSLLGMGGILDPDLAAFVGLLVEVTTPVVGNTEALVGARDRLAATLGEGSADRAVEGELLHDYVSDRNVLLLLSLAAARLGDTVEALRYADSLARPPEAASGSEAWASLARATAAHWSGDHEGALRLLEDVDRSFPAGWQAFLRAEALRATGAYEEALRWYATLPSDYVFASLLTATSHLRRAELYRRLGRRTDSQRHLRRTAELWADADPAFRSLLREARSVGG